MADDLQIIACPHPFRADRIEMAIPYGATVAEILTAVQPRAELLPGAHVFVGEVLIERPLWSVIRPAPGQVITIRVVPHGGSGKKNPLAIVLSIALLAATPYLGTLVYGQLGLGLVIGKAGIGVGMALVGMAGALAINAIAPPPKPKMDALSGSGGQESQTYSIAGGRNRLAPYDVVPQVLGRHLIIPPYGAPPYTELVGQDQYLRMLFVLGYGPLDIAEPKIGETSLLDYQGVQMEPRYGYPDDPPLKLFPGTVSEEAVGATLNSAADWVTRTTAPNTEEIGVEVGFAQGLVQFDDLGERQQVSVEVEAQYSVVGSGQWRRLVSEVFYGGGEVSWVYPPRDSWYSEDIYYTTYRTDLVCIGEDSGALQYIAGVESTAGQPTQPATPHRHQPICRIEWVSGAGGTVVDMRPALLTVSDAGNFTVALVQTGSSYKITVASGSFLGPKTIFTDKKAAALRYGLRQTVPAGQYEVRVRRITPDSTSNKVSDVCIWSLLRSMRYSDPISLPGLAKVALRIKATDQLSGIIDQFSVVATSICKHWDGSAWVERPTSNPAALVRHVLQGGGNGRPVADSKLDLPALQALSTVCDSKGWSFGATIDSSTTVFQLCNDILSTARASFGVKDGKYSVVRDMLQASPVQHFTPRNSWGFSASKAFTEVPHALRVRFVSAADGYRQGEVIVYADGYTAANATRFENLDLFGLTSSDQAWKQGRYYLAQAILRPETYTLNVDIEHIVCTRGDLVRVSHDVTLHGIAAGRVKSVSLNGSSEATAVTLDEMVPMEDGKAYGLRFRLADGRSITAAVVTAAGETATLTLSPAIPAGDVPEAGDLCSFGEVGEETVEMIVTRIEMLDDLAARLILVDAAPGVHSADSGPIPPYEPQITIPADVTRIPPAAPQILGMVSDDRALIRRADGTIISRVLVSFAAGSGGGRTATIELQFRTAGSIGAWSVVPAVNADAGEVVVDAVEDGVTYDIRLRSLSPYGVPSAWTTGSHTVVGKLAPPPDPEVFLVSVQPDGTREFTARVSSPPVDFAGYLIRYRSGNDWQWDAMYPLHDGILAAMPWETNQLAAGDYVFAVKTVDTTGNLSTGAKYIELTIPDPRLAGVLDMFSEFKEGWPGTKVGCFVTEEGFLSALDADTWADKTTWDAWTRWNQNPINPIVYERTIDLGAVAAFQPLVSVQCDGSATVEEQHGDDGLTWSDWEPAGVLITGRYLRVRVTVAGAYPIIREVQTLLSAKPLSEDIEDLDTSTLTGANRIGVGDVRLPIRMLYAVIRRVEVALQNVGPSYSWELIDKDKDLGPRIKIYNGTTPADAVVDATVRGVAGYVDTLEDNLWVDPETWVDPNTWRDRS